MAKSTFWADFKAFAMKGNVVDMAVGVVIGGAFGKIVTSLVSDLIMPLVGALIGNVNFSTLSLTLREAILEGEEIVKPAVVLNYGNFIQTMVDFIIIAFCIFLVIKAITKAQANKEEPVAEPEAPAPKPDDVVLLEEIRDLLKEQKK